VYGDQFYNSMCGDKGCGYLTH